MKSDKLYIITAAIILVLCFSFLATCEKASQTFDSKEHEMGFLYEYAESNLENDLNSFAENIFMGEESFLI